MVLFPEAVVGGPETPDGQHPVLLVLASWGSVRNGVAYTKLWNTRCTSSSCSRRSTRASTSVALSSGSSVGVVGMNSASADPQPKMQTALAELKAAAKSLAEANHDKGGHRAKALELTRSAIDQVEAGIKFDNRH